MILIGQYDSPFVRRVGIALRLYGMAFEHRPLSAFADREALGAINPLMRVPALVLDDGLAITDSHMMLDYLDSRVSAPMFPRAEPARHRALRVAALACGMADKAVALFYEKRLHNQPSDAFVQRCTSQILAALQVLETDIARQPRPFWFATSISHSDIAVTCALRFIADAHPGLIAPGQFSHLQEFAATFEGLEVFQDISQPFVAPA
jgi:glutathione S-transferase